MRQDLIVCWISQDPAFSLSHLHLSLYFSRRHIVGDYRLPRHPHSVVSDCIPLAPGNAVPRSEIITLAQHRVSRDGWDVYVILTFQLIAEHLFSHVGKSAAEIMFLLKNLSNTVSLSLSVIFDFRGLMLSPVDRLLILTLAVMCI